MFERDRQLFVEVADWGVGFNPDAVTEHRFGLQGMRERVRLMEGKVTIQSGPNQGTIVSVRLPVVEATSEPAAAPEAGD